MNKKRIVYIMGAGRSGTTIMGILLGNEYKHYHVGEINKFYEYKGVPHARKKEHPCYKLYEDIFQNKFASYSEKELLLTDSLEYHTNAIKTLFGLRSFKTKNKYYDIQERLYDSLFEKLCVDIIVDSSKYPLRAYMLSYMKKYNVSLIFIKRSFKEVYRSFRKKDVEQPSQNIIFVVLYYYLVNLLSFFVFCVRFRKRKVFVRFDDIKKDPVGVVKDISKKIGINYDNVCDMIEKKKVFNVGCVFEGNRVRLRENVSLMFD